MGMNDNGAIGCTNCTSVYECNRQCVLHTGQALLSLIEDINTIETCIGDFETSTRNGPKDLMVIGNQMFNEDESISKIMVHDLSISMNVTSKFKTVFQMNPTQVVQEFAKAVELSNEKYLEIADKILKINKNKMMIVPFKTGTTCTIMANENQSKREAKIESVKWKLNKETGQIEQTLIFDNVDNTSIKKLELNVNQYMKRFRLSQLEIWAKGDKFDIDIIKMTETGLIKPISITDGRMTLSVDNTYVYLTQDRETRIIGYWNNREEFIEMEKLTQFKKTKVFDKFYGNLRYITNHRKYIAPYMTFEANEITV